VNQGNPQYIAYWSL